MEALQFIDINANTVLILFLVGFVAGMVSGFIGSGGAFVLTPAMMSLGVPAAMAVASNMAHKFPKALVGAYKRNRYGQVDIKLGIVMGLFAEAGVLFGKNAMVGVREAFGATGTNLYVSAIFVVVLAVVGGFVLRDALRERRGEAGKKTPGELNRLARWVRSLHIPGTMVYFKSINARISVLVIAPLGFATGVLAASIAVGGFIGVPAMMYILGLPALVASATELVIAFVMGLGGSFLYAMDGFVDIRLSMIILAGSLFGVQIGAIGTTYVKEHVIKFVMAAIMLLVLFSRFFYIPGYLADLEMIAPLDAGLVSSLNGIGQALLAFALLFGAAAIAYALMLGVREHRVALAAAAAAPVEVAAPVEEAAAQLSPVGRFKTFLVASDGSEYSAPAFNEAVNMAQKCGAELNVMTLVATDVDYEAVGDAIIKQEIEAAEGQLEQLCRQAEAAGVSCRTHLVNGQSIAEEIVELADELKADLIIMGRRGRRGLALRMLGRATTRVIGSAPCNVLVVPRIAKTIEGRHMVLATDGSRSADTAAVTTGFLAKFCETPVTVMSIIKPTHGEERRGEAGQVVQQVVQHMTSEGISAEGIVAEGHPEEVIVNVAREKNADMIIAGSHGRTGLQRVLLGSTTERILNETECAVLVVKGS